MTEAGKNGFEGKQAGCNLLFTLALLVLVGFGVWEAYLRPCYRLAREGKRTKATVTYYFSKTWMHQEPPYGTRVEETEHHIRIRYDGHSRLIEVRRPYSEGDVVEVVYLPEKPETVMLVDREASTLSIAWKNLSSFGQVFLATVSSFIVGILLIIPHLGEARSSATTPRADPPDPELSRRLNRAASQLGGLRVDRSIVFRVAGLPARMMFEKGRVGVDVHLRESSPGTFNFVRRGAIDRLARRLLGSGKQDVGRDYRFWAVPESLEGTLLKTREWTGQIQHLESLGRPSIWLAFETLHVRISGMRSTEAEIVRLGRTVKELVQQIVERRRMQTSAAPNPIDGTCMICTSSLRSSDGTTRAKPRIVACRRCRRRHHEKCWLYFGLCSAYACGERSFERV